MTHSVAMQGAGWICDVGGDAVYRKTTHRDCRRAGKTDASKTVRDEAAVVSVDVTTARKPAF